MLLGPLLARFGEAYICQHRVVIKSEEENRYSLSGFVELGAEFHYDEEQYFYSLKAKNFTVSSSYWKSFRNWYN